jgi:hypothetical protein
MTKGRLFAVFRLLPRTDLYNKHEYDREDETLLLVQDIVRLSLILNVL